MSINEAKWTLFFFLCFHNNFLFPLTFLLTCHAGIVSRFFHSLSTAAFAPGIFIAWSTGINLCTKLQWVSEGNPFSAMCACDLRAPLRLTRPLEAHPGATTFPPVEHSWPKSQLFWRAHPLPTGTFSVPTITGGYARTWRPLTRPLRRPDCTLSSLHTGVRLAGDPVDSDPGARFPGPTLDRAAREGLGCVTTPGRRSLPGWACRSVPWILTVFTGLACYLGASQDRWGLSSSVPRGGHLPLRVLATPTRRYHGRTLIRPSSHECATPAGRCSHTRRFGTLGSAAACWGPALGTPSPWPSSWFLGRVHSKRFLVDSWASTIQVHLGFLVWVSVSTRYSFQ